MEEEVIRCRKAANFQRKYLNKLMNEKIKIYRILDSENEKFNLSGPYKTKVEGIVNVITKPEIEMLLIHSENCYQSYVKNKSECIAKHLKRTDVKSATFIKSYFSDIDRLKKAIHSHHSKAKDQSNTIYQLILKK